MTFRVQGILHQVILAGSGAHGIATVANTLQPPYNKWTDLASIERTVISHVIDEFAVKRSSGWRGPQGCPNKKNQIDYYSSNSIETN
jgi:hypothetical protein